MRQSPALLCCGLLGCTTSLTEETRIARYLRNDDAETLIIEVDVAGSGAPEDVWQRLAESFQELTGKTNVQIEFSEISVEETVWSKAALEALADTEADAEEANTVRIHVLLLPGTHAETPTALGTALDHQSIVLFSDILTQTCSDVIENDWSDQHAERVCVSTWRGVLSHEFGHVLGLVNDGLPMVRDHEDPLHSRHDPDDNCLMYWSYDGPEMANNIANNAHSDEVIDLGFCDDSLDDIAALQQR